MYHLCTKWLEIGCWELRTGVELLGHEVIKMNLICAVKMYFHSEDGDCRKDKYINTKPSNLWSLKTLTPENWLVSLISLSHKVSMARLWYLFALHWHSLMKWIYHVGSTILCVSSLIEWAVEWVFDENSDADGLRLINVGGCVGWGVTISLLRNMWTTEDMVGLPSEISWTDNNPIWMHFIASFTGYVHSSSESTRSIALPSFHSFHACKYSSELFKV